MWTHHIQIKGSNKSLVFEGIPTSFFCLSPNLANSSHGRLPTHLLHKFGKKKKTLVLTPLLSMCEGRSKFVLFCFVVMRSTKLGYFKLCWCLWKALNEKGCISLVPLENWREIQGRTGECSQLYSSLSLQSQNPQNSHDIASTSE